MKKSCQSLLLILLTLLFLRLEIARANVVGTDLQNFNPITSGLDFVTVQSSETLEPGVVNLGLFFNDAVNTLPRFNATGTTNRTKVDDNLFSADLNFGVGLMKNWDAGMSFPFVLAQSVDQEYDQLIYDKTGNNEIKANSKVRLFGDKDHGFAFIASMNFNTIEDNPYSGVDAGPTFNLEAAYDFTIERVAIGFNIGHRWRQPGDRITTIPIEPFKDSFIFSMAASYLLTSIDTKVIGEIFGSVPTEDLATQPNRSQESLELLLGVKHDCTTNLALHGGVGTELIQGAASPDYRIYAGLNYSFGPLWGKEEEKVIVPDLYPVAKVRTFTIPDILFAFDSDEVRFDQYKTSFDKMVEYLNSPPVFSRLEINGHTDSVGAETYNLDLSRRRAANIRKALLENYKLDPKKIKAFGFGESQPIADNGNFQGREKNRRVEFKIYRD